MKCRVCVNGLTGYVLERQLNIFTYLQQLFAKIKRNLLLKIDSIEGKISLKLRNIGIGYKLPTVSIIIYGNLLIFLCSLIYSEDILNYEIGDVDADDTDLTGADEDELLLSDDGKIAFQLY